MTNFSTYNGRFMTKIVRVGVTFPPDLLKDFDKLINRIGYENRSKAIQDEVVGCYEVVVVVVLEWFS